MASRKQSNCSWSSAENSPGLDAGPDRVVRWTGTRGDLSTQSFYPPHHLTMGEGGAVNIVRDAKLKVIAESFIAWGRDCWCPIGIDNTYRLRPQVHLQPPGLQSQAAQSACGDRPAAAAAAAGVHRGPQTELRISAPILVAYEVVLEFALPTHCHRVGFRSGFFLGCHALPFGLQLV